MARKSLPAFGLIALAVFFAGTAVEPASAQRPTRFQSNRPTVSPYLNLLRFNPSPLPNYQALVRPALQQGVLNRQQQAFSQQQQTTLIQQNAVIQRLQSDLVQAQQGPATGSSSGFQAPGSRATFQNSSRYFRTR